MKKGLELPLNMIVLIAIAVLVLVVVAAYFASQTGQGFQTINDLQALNTGCQLWLSNGCSGSADTIIIRDYKPLAATTDQALSVACERNGLDATTGLTRSGACGRRCGCPT